MPRLNHVRAVFAFASAVALTFALSAGTVYGSNENAANTLALEKQLEEKLRPVLMEIIGSEKIVVLVNVDPQLGESGKRQEAVLLPGVPLKNESKKDEDADSSAFKSSLSKLAIKKLAVTVILDTGISDALKDTVRDVTAAVLGLNKTRGDELYIKQIDFRNKRFAWSSLFYPQNLSLLVLSLVGAFFLITASLFLRDPFNKLGDALKGLGLGGGGEAASEKSEKNIIELHTESAGATSGKNDDEHPSEGAALPFAFIRERHLSDLAFLLKDKPLQDAAVVVNYLGPELANIFLEHFPEEKRIEIALSLSTVDINPGKTRALEEKIREDLDFVVGGERKLAAFLNAADEDVREKIIARLEKKDAASAQRLRLHVRDLESFLRDMPASGIAILYRHVNAALFAQILKATSAEVQQKVFGSLSAGAGERLKQELDLSRPLSPARLKKERQNIAAIIRRLIKEGHVEVENN